MSLPILKITDGANTVDLLSVSSGLLLDDWTPAIAQLKGGGTYQQSTLSDGKQLVMANYDNAIETFNLKVHAGNQNAVIEHTQRVFRLLEAARSYWFTPYLTTPVWLIARAPDETNTRYAIIHNYQQSGLDNPYALPFFACTDAALDNITLVIERGHWANVEPGTGECVAISSNKEAQAEVLEFSVSADADDNYAKLNGGHASCSFFVSGATYIACGKDNSGDRYGMSVRFSSVTIPTGAVITRAYLRFRFSFWARPGEPLNDMIIYGDDVDSATAPTNCATWNAKNLTGSSRIWTLPTGAPGPHGAIYDTPDIKHILDEISGRVGWSSGDPMQFFVDEYNCSLDAWWAFTAHEAVDYDEPKLFIEYTVESGLTVPTCDPKVWLVDKSHTAVLTHGYLWDGAAWSANVIGDAEIDLTDDPPAVGDKFYFGATAGPFNNIVLSMKAFDPANQTTVVWEYWQGAPTSAWTQFTGNRIVDSTSNFQASGWQSVTFIPPIDPTNGDWVAGDLNAIAPDGTPPSVTAFWIRVRVTAVGGAPTVIQVYGTSENLYTVTWPYIQAGEDEIGGDIPALARVSFDSSGQGTTPGPTVRHRAILALSTNRGPFGDLDSYDFNAYLPCADEQFTNVMYSQPSFTPGNMSFVNDVSAPSGRCIQWSPIDATEGQFVIYINSLHFFGSYRAFMRVRQIGGTAGDFWVRVQTSAGWTSTAPIYADTRDVYTKIKSVTVDPNWQLMDFGLIDIPAGLPGISSDEGATTMIKVLINQSAWTGDLHFMDLILMPTDEWIADLQDIMLYEGWSQRRFLHVDSVSVPKVDLRALSKYGGSPAGAIPFPWKAVGTQFRLPANVQSKIWYLTARWDDTAECWLSGGITTSRVQMWSAEQYLGLRGSR